MERKKNNFCGFSDPIHIYMYMYKCFKYIKIYIDKESSKETNYNSRKNNY